MFAVCQRWALAGRAARHQEVHAAANLAPHKLSQRSLIKRKIRLKWRNQRRTASNKSHRDLLLQIELKCSTISRNSKNPVLPTNQRAARKAPCAKPSRLRAVCRNVIVSSAESNPISWVPGTAPARFAVRLTGRA